MVDSKEQSQQGPEEGDAGSGGQSRSLEGAPAENGRDAGQAQPIDELADEMHPAPDEEDLVPQQMRDLEEAFEADNLEDAADPMAILQGQTPESAQYPGSQDTGIPSTISPIPRAARARRYRASQGRAHAMQFKALMVPLLLAVGGLLLLIGVICLLAGPPQSDRAVMIRGELLGLEYMTWITILSFPVGAILLLGAWLFRRDVRDAEKGGR